jgi:hypothetical protein
MKPLNSAERTNAFLRFLLLFLITVALMITVIFFSIQLPWVENNQLRDQVVKLQREKESSEAFGKDMKEAQLALKNYTNKDELSVATQAKVQNGIDKLRDRVRKIPNGENSMYELIVENLTELNEAKRKLKDAKLDQ